MTSVPPTEWPASTFHLCHRHLSRRCKNASEIGHLGHGLFAPQRLAEPNSTVQLSRMHWQLPRSWWNYSKSEKTSWFWGLQMLFPILPLFHSCLSKHWSWSCQPESPGHTESAAASWQNAKVHVSHKRRPPSWSSPRLACNCSISLNPRHLLPASIALNFHKNLWLNYMTQWKPSAKTEDSRVVR